MVLAKTVAYLLDGKEDKYMLKILLDRSRICCRKSTGTSLHALVTSGIETEVTLRKLSWKEWWWVIVAGDNQQGV